MLRKRVVLAKRLYEVGLEVQWVENDDGKNKGAAWIERVRDELDCCVLEVWSGIGVFGGGAASVDFTSEEGGVDEERFLLGAGAGGL